MRFSFPKEFSKNPYYRTQPVAHHVPIATVRDNIYILADGSFVAVWKVKGLEDELASDRDVAKFYNNLQAVLNLMPPDMQFKLLHRIHHNYRDLLEDHEKALDGQNEFARFVAWDQQQRFKRGMEHGDILRSDNLIILTYNPKINWLGVSGGIGDKIKALAEDLARTGMKSMYQMQKKRYQDAYEKFSSYVNPIVHQMEMAGLNPDRLQDSQLYDLAWEVLNPRESLKRKRPEIFKPLADDPLSGIFSQGSGAKAAKKNPAITVVAPLSEREQLCVSDWRVDAKWMRIDDLYYGAVVLRRLPTATHAGIGRVLAAQGFECSIAIDAVMLQKSSELSKQWAEARSAQGKAEVTLFAGAAVDPLKQEQAADIKASYMQLSAAHENPLKVRITVVVSASSPEELDERIDGVISSMRDMNQAEGIREKYGVREAIKGCWPFSTITDFNYRKTNTSHVVNMMPLVSHWEGSKRPITLFMDSGYRLVKHDPFPTNQLNKNRTICGKSGSGKSFAAQLADVQPHAARAGTEIMIVESGGSFELTTKCFGGVYLKLGPTCPYQINAFDLPPGFASLPPDKQEEELRFKYMFIKNLVLCMARMVDPESQMVAESVVSSVCQRTYNTFPAPRLGDFYKLLGEYTNKGDPGAEALAGRLRTRLSSYVQDGIYARYFDCQTNFDVKANIVCFDLMDVKNDRGLLDPMAMITILGLIYNRLMLRDGTERLIVIDEAWALIKEQAGGESPAGQGIELFWREGRKLAAASTMISQNFSDMMTDKIGRAVVGNSPIQYFLVHEPLKPNTDAFLDAEFSQAKIDRVYNLNTKYGDYSEIMIKEGPEWGVVRLPSVGLKYWLATTDPQDFKVRDRYFETYGKAYGLDDRTVVALLAEDYPHGTHGAQRSKKMNEQEALRYGEWWQTKYQEFSQMVKSGKQIPPNFKMEYSGRRSGD